MRRFAAVMVVLLSSLIGLGPRALAATNPKPLGVPGSWTYIGGDEFNGTHVNTQKWYVQGRGYKNGCKPHRFLEWCTSQVHEGNGRLTITGKPKNVGGGVRWIVPSTRHHGLWEVRMRIIQWGPGKPWNVAALLLPPSIAGWPSHTELDFAEIAANRSRERANLHYGPAGATWGHGVLTDRYYTGYWKLSRWFTVDIRTAPHSISEWFNGHHWFTDTNHSLLRELNETMHIQLQLGEVRKGARNHVEMQVDYVRMWKPAT